MGLFKKNKDKKKAGKSSIKPINYPPKILVAWGEAISGNSKILDWLMKNGYPELGIFCHALKNDVKGKDYKANCMGKVCTKYKECQAHIIETNVATKSSPSFLSLEMCGETLGNHLDHSFLPFHGL